MPSDCLMFHAKSDDPVPTCAQSRKIMFLFEYKKIIPYWSIFNILGEKLSPR